MKSNRRLPDSKHFRLQQLVEGVYAAIHIDGGAAIGNAGIVDLGDRTLIYDTFIAPQAAQDLRRELAKHESEPLVDRLTYLLQTFAFRTGLAEPAQSETEIVAMLRAFLDSAMPSVTVIQEPLIKDDMSSLRPDLIVQDSKEKIVVEVKRYREWNERVHRAATDQVRRYLKAADIHSGVLIAIPTQDAEKPHEKYDTVLAEQIGPDRWLVTIRLLPKPDEEEKR